MSGRVTLDVAYERELGGEGPEAYVRLLDDALSGDQRLFARQDNVEAAWAVVDEVLRAPPPRDPVRARTPGGPRPAPRILPHGVEWAEPERPEGDARADRRLSRRRPARELSRRGARAARSGDRRRAP